MVSLEDEGALRVLRFVPPHGERDEGDYLAALAAIAETGRPFALLAVFGGEGRLSQAGERAQALWFKGSRARIERDCWAIALVRPGATPRMAETFRKLWSMPLAVTQDEAGARRFLAAQAPGRSAGRGETE
ncbi:hypothetical protein M446_5065 [Methylobacterium sp. 4-46]|uniref:hypothetical protein n=1 Tax=unclassified Methylobacterium TaxID=2615210 RepID=UPI000152DD03|nr:MULTISPECIES: hypothetical protein [Methylobacterium]ACA19392.1 hypothetical protein M446_5065 [Methylobacterium sp. 4-46]WFT78589.1 hypothetical protein QA634_25460 [Methylobacterium nodulans]